jgi:hypothetical protein
MQTLRVRERERVRERVRERERERRKRGYPGFRTDFHRTGNVR